MCMCVCLHPSGHYDVQPAQLEDGWSSDPFKMVVHEDGRMVGRGTTDDKGTSVRMLPIILAFFVPANAKANRPHANRLIRHGPGPLLGWIWVIEAYRALGKELPVNLRIIFEGMEGAFFSSSRLFTFFFSIPPAVMLTSFIMPRGGRPRRVRRVRLRGSRGVDRQGAQRLPQGR